MMNIAEFLVLCAMAGIRRGSGVSGLICRLATTGNLAGYTYSNGTDGVGATLTAGSTGVLNIDGVAASVNDYVLIKSQTAPEQNGIYVVTVNSAGAAAVLTRAPDFDSTEEIQPGVQVSVLQGDTLAATQWIMTQTTTVIVGTTAITFAEQSISGALMAALDLSDLVNVALAQNNLQIPTGVQNLQKSVDISFVNSGANNTTTFTMAGAIFINNTKPTTQTLIATLPAMNSTSPNQKSILPGQTIMVANVSVNADTETHPIQFNDSIAGGIVTLQTGQMALCTLLDNGTPQGLWASRPIGTAAGYNIADIDIISYPLIAPQSGSAKVVNNLVTYATTPGAIKDSGISASSLPIITKDTLTTTDGNFNTISNIPIDLATAKKLKISVLGKKVGGIGTSWGSLDITISRDSSGDITLIGTPVFNKDQSTIEDINYSIDTGLENLIINVKGINLQTYKWTCEYTTQLLTDA